MFSLAPPILSSASANNSDDIVAAIIAAGGTLSSTEEAALRTFVSALVSAGVWQKALFFYGIMGGVNSAHAINWASPGTYDMTYSGVPISSALGLQFNGAHGDTGFASSLLPSLPGVTLSLYSRDSDAKLGTVDVGAGAPRLYCGITPTYAYVAPHSTSEFGAAVTSPKHAVAKRESSTNIEQTLDGALFTSYSEPVVYTTSTILIGALRLGGVPAFFQSATSVCQSYGLWSTLTSAQISALYNAELTLNTALGRA